MKLGKSGTERSRERCWRQERKKNNVEESKKVEITGLVGEIVEQRGLTCQFPADCMTVSPNNWGHRRRNNFS